jgi:alpha-glucosidase
MGDLWWQHGVIYQIYPRSFQDSDGDGIGDLDGIRQRLDYLQWLGVDAVWLSPIFPSPMADFGYDVADYTGVDPMFGTLADVDELIRELHARDMRLVLDYVPNHSSDRHPWFLDARSSRDSQRRDWYIWRDPGPDGEPPNDWQSAFGGSAWELDERTGQYYFHSFLKEQPDLNWDNPEVRQAMGDVLRFWLDRGVDGFRIDVLWILAKGPEVEPTGDAPSADGPPATSPLAGDQDGVHDIIEELRGITDAYDERLLIGEIYLPLERLVRYYGTDGGGVHLPFNFHLVLIDWEAAEVHATVKRYEELLPTHAWPNWVLGNHDKSRVASRVGAAQARVAAILLLTLRGTPTLYYGDEIGMADAEVPQELRQDPQGLRGGESRDPQRAPMRWQPGPTAGFTTGQPWLPIGPAVAEANVAGQRDDSRSMLSLHHRLLALRRREAALNRGSWHDLGRHGSVIAYLREHEDRRFLIVLNLSSEPADAPADARALSGTVAIATTLEHEGQPYDGGRTIAPDEGLVVELR